MRQQTNCMLRFRFQKYFENSLEQAGAELGQAQYTLEFLNFQLDYQISPTLQSQLAPVSQNPIVKKTYIIQNRYLRFSYPQEIRLTSGLKLAEK